MVNVTGLNLSFELWKDLLGGTEKPLEGEKRATEGRVLEWIWGSKSSPSREVKHSAQGQITWLLEASPLFRQCGGGGSGLLRKNEVAS